MELPYPAEGIILSSDRYRENDRLLSIYTREFGKIRAISRGSRKMDSKLSPHLEPLTWANLMLINGKGIITLTGSSQIKNFSNLKSKGAYVLLALHLAALVDEVTLENLPDEKNFQLLLDLLKYLDGPKPKLAMSEIITVFKLKLLEFLGLRPEEISAMPAAVLKMAQSESFNRESAGWREIPRQKLNKILDNALIDVLNHPVIGFDNYVCFHKE